MQRWNGRSWAGLTRRVRANTRRVRANTAVSAAAGHTAAMVCGTLGVLLALVAAGCGSEDRPREHRATVHISGIACSEQREGVGVIIADDLILTSGHVVDSLQEPSVIIGPDLALPARVVHIDRVLDLALVKAEVDDVGVGVTAAAQAGSDGVVHVMDSDGAREEIAFTVDRRIVARTLDVGRNNEITRPSLQLTSALARGDSGAALWNATGEIVGVVWAVSSENENRAFAVQGEEIAGMIARAETDPSGPGIC